MPKVIDLPTATTMDDSDYLLMEESSGGTKKITRANANVSNSYRHKYNFNQTCTITLPGSYRGILYVLDSDVAKCGEYIVFATGAGVVSYKTVAAANSLTLTASTNRLVITATGTPWLILEDVQGTATIA